MSIDIGFTSMRSRFVYGLTGLETTLDMEIPHRFVDPVDDTIGGRRIASAGVGASFIVRRDEIYNVPLRFREADWPLVLDLLEWGQTEESFTWYPDVDDLLTSFDVYLHSPEAGERVTPTRNSEYPYMYELTVELRVSPILVIAPSGYPSLDLITPAGTYADFLIGNHNQVGNEIIELWLIKHVSGSGGVENPDTDVYRGATDLSEFALGAGIPTGITAAGLDNGGAPDTFAIENDLDGEGNYLSMSGHNAFNAQSLFSFDDFDGDWWPGDPQIEILARVWVGPTTRSNHWMLGIGFLMDGALASQIDVTGLVGLKQSGPSLRTDIGGMTNGNIGTHGSAATQTAVGNGQWHWARFRFERNAGMVNWDYRSKIWLGDLADEPGTWDNTQLNKSFVGNINGQRMGVFMPQGITPGVDQDEQRVAFFSWTTDWLNYPVIEPDDLQAEGVWFLAAEVPVSQLSQQTIRELGLEPSTGYDAAVRYRRNGLYNAGAENTDDPSTWPSIARGTFETTIDPPTIESATWSRVSAGVEQIELSITPLAGAETLDIEIWRGVEAGTPVLIDTIAGPHSSPFAYQDTTISGEVGYTYYAVTSGSSDSPLSEGVRCWSGPAGIPAFNYFFFGSNNYTVGFTTTNATADTELHDNMNDAGDPSFPAAAAFDLHDTVSPPDTEIERATAFNELDDFTWNFKMRHTETAFAVQDYGEFGPTFEANWPEGIL